MRKIAEMLPSVSDPPLAAFLRAMADGHRVNISTLEARLKDAG